MIVLKSKWSVSDHLINKLQYEKKKIKKHNSTSVSEDNMTFGHNWRKSITAYAFLRTTKCYSYLSKILGFKESAQMQSKCFTKNNLYWENGNSW